MIKTQNAKVNLYRQVALAFIGLTIVLFISVLYFSLAKAEVAITPMARTSNVDFIAEVGPSAQSEVLVGGVAETEVSGEKTFTVTNTKDIPSDTLGQVTLHNETNNPQVLVATTRLLSADNILLRLKDRVTVPAQGVVKAEVYADKSSSFTTLEPGKFTIPGLRSELQAKIYGQTDTKLTAGTKQIRILTQEEIDKDLASYTQELSEQALNQLASKLNAQLDKTQIKSEVLESKVSDISGTETDNFKISLKVKVAGVSFSRDELLKMAQQKLLGYLPQERDINSLSGGQLDYTIQSYDLTSQQAKLRVSYQTNFWLEPGVGILDKTKLVGLTAEEVKQYFAQYPEVKEAKIKLTPPWAQKLPNDKDKITITINNQ